MHADPNEGEAAVTSPSEITPTPPSAPERDEDGTDGILAPTVLETLRRQAQGGGESRRVDLMILPGRFNSALAGRYMPADWDEIRREAKRRRRRGQNDDLDFVAFQVAMACEEILIRPKPGADFIGLGESMGLPPITYGPELLEVLDLLDPGDPKPSPSAAIRVLFRNKEALVAHAAELTAWQREEDPDEDDGEPDPT